jgi:hypothetical protein
MPIIVSPGFVGKRSLLIEGAFYCFALFEGNLSVSFVAPKQSG